jgi:hypothetical protein
MPNPWDNDPIVSAPPAPAGGIYTLPRDPAKDRAEARAAASDARAADAAQRASAEWNASHNPDGTPKVQAPSLLGDPTKTGPAYMATLPQNIRGRVQQLLDGRSLLTAREKGQPLGQQLMDAANQADPTFDENVSHARYVARTQYTGQGKGSQVVQAADRLAQHAHDMYEASRALGGPDLGFTPLSNMATATTNSFRQAKVAKYKTILPIIQGEIQKMTKNGAATEGEAQHIMDSLSVNQPQDVREAALKEVIRLSRAQVQPLRDSWESAWAGSTAPPMPMDFRPQTMAIFDTIENGKDPLPHDKRGELIVPPTYGGNAGGGANPTGPDLTPAGGDTKTETFQSDSQKKLAGMLAAGSPSANIRAFAKANDLPMGQVEKTLAWRAMNPNYKGGYDVHSEQIVPTTTYNKMAASPLAAGLLAAADTGTAGLTDEATGAVNALRTGQPLSTAIDAADYAKQMNLAANPRAALAGSVAGGLGAMLTGGAAARGALGGGKLAALAAANPVKAAALGDLIYGGAYGAGENNDNRALGAGVGGVTGLLGSFAGQGASRILGAGLRGVTNPAVDRLRAAGIPLTVGETLGGGWKSAQDAMTSVFGPGNMVARRYGEGRRALNEAAYNAAGNEVGTPINAVGQQGIQAVEAAKTNAYSNALDPVSLDLNDPAFIASMTSALNKGDAIPPGELPQGFASNTLKHYIGNQADPSGMMTGPAFQRAYRGLAQSASKAAPKVEGAQVGEALGQGKDALATALETQNPGAYADFLKANSANRHLSVLRKALDAAQGQVSDNGEQLFTPLQLGRAATNNAQTYGGKAASAAGNRPFNQLALDASQVMSSKLPDSGTATRRLMQTAVLGGGLAAPGAGLGYDQGGAGGAVAGGLGTAALLTALGTKKGQQYLTAALLNRVAPFRVAGQSKALSGPLGGDILASFGIPLATGQ